MPKEAKSAPVDALDCPEHVDDETRALWERLAPALAKVGTLTREDALALEMLCAAYSDYRRAVAMIAEAGEVYETEGQGGAMLRAHPAVGMRNDAWRRVIAAAAEFGLTPSSRSRVAAAGGLPADPFEEFLAGRA